MTPVLPLCRALGMNTAASTEVMATIAPVIWCMALRVASLGPRWSSRMMRSTASTTTMASSTTMPIASTIANNVSWLMEKPTAYIPTSVPSSAEGTTRVGMSVARKLIPTLVVPSALLGTLVGMYAVGFSINQLTLFAMVLAIGIVVDDAIVVVEAVERIMREDHLGPKEATRKAMHQITGAIVAITSVLAAVFIPSALQSGSTGVIYRQFALTIALSMAFSALLALSFTPALCASLLRPEHLRGNVIFNWFNRAYEGTRRSYVQRVFVSVGHAPRWMAGFALMLAVGVLLFARLPGSFVPDEDQGYALVDVQLPEGASMPRTREVLQHINTILMGSPDVANAFLIVGSSFTGTGENAGRAFVHLKPWDERPDTAADFIRWANETFAHEIHDAKAYVINLPTVRGLGVFGGFDFYLEDRGGLGRAALA